MPYRVYHATVVVLSSRAVGESDREYRLYVREFGLLRVRARATRLLRSKLRYVLQPFHLLRADLVRGKAGWRLTSAMLLAQYSNVGSSKDKRIALTQGFRLVARLVHMEEPVPGLFEDLADFLRIADRSSPEDVRSYELAFAARTLHRLGYWGSRETDPEVFAGALGNISPAYMKEHHRRIVSMINAALRASHL